MAVHTVWTAIPRPDTRDDRRSTRDFSASGHRPGGGAAADRLPARAPAGRQLPDQGLPGRREHAARSRPPRRSGPGTPPAPCATCPGSGRRPPRSSRSASPGAVPAYLAELEATAGPLADGGADHRAALRGDLHSHSDWSDGGSPIEEMAMTAIELGHEYLVLTDHSPRLTVANGLTVARLTPAARRGRRRQRAASARTAVSGCCAASRSTSSTTAPWTRPTRCWAASTSWSPPCTPSSRWRRPR